MARLSRLPPQPSLSGRLAVLVLVASACGQKPDAAAATHAPMGPDVLARVGDVDLSSSLVASVASARRVSSANALALVVGDAVAAAGAQARGLAQLPKVAFAETAVRGRATLDRLKEAAEAFPPTDDEVRALSAKHWTRVDAPPSVVVIHAVVLRPKKPDARSDAAARAVAETVATAEIGAISPEDFEARANAVPHAEVELVVQQLDPVTADGRVAVAGDSSTYDPKFAAAAAALQAPGQTSGVVESSFGWHVIRLIERRPRTFVSFEERRQMFAQEVYGQRNYDAVETLTTSRREREGVVVENGVDDLLAASFVASFRGAGSPSSSLDRANEAQSRLPGATATP